MQNPIIGKCPRCGVGTAQLFPPMYQALVDSGQVALTCGDCQEAAIAKRTAQLIREIEETVRDPSAKKAAIEEAIKKARAKVVEPAPAAKTEEKPAASEPAK